MFLKSLKIQKGTDIIRDIKFVKGLNLIVDETPSDKSNLKKSGNNVGKTTVLRLIDYCLGGDSKSIYQDSENKNQKKLSITDYLGMVTSLYHINLECRTIRDLLNNHNEHKVMFLRIDTSVVNGIFGTIDGFTYLFTNNIDEIVLNPKQTI